jgi:hypothetical protein
MRPYAASVCGLELLVYEALLMLFSCLRCIGSSALGLKLLVYAVLLMLYSCFTHALLMLYSCLRCSGSSARAPLRNEVHIFFFRIFFFRNASHDSGVSNLALVRLDIERFLFFFSPLFFSAPSKKTHFSLMTF